MYILRAFALLFLTQAVLARQPTPILPYPKLTPGDTFDVTAQDVCVPGYAKKVRAVPAWLKRQAYAEYGITEYKTGDYEVDHLIPPSLGGSNSIRKIKVVHEEKTEFKIEFEDGLTTTLWLADPGSSVSVRDKNNAVEYLG
jgi:hypothetical protein